MINQLFVIINSLQITVFVTLIVVHESVTRIKFLLFKESLQLCSV